MTSHSGEFSTHVRVGAHVTKRLTGRHPAGQRFAEASARCGDTGMRRYLDTLRDAGVTLPAGLTLKAGDPLTVRHRWVQGPTLPEASRTDPLAFASAVGVVGQWVRNLAGADARIDANLANFCLDNGSPVLVDVLPPLIPSLRPGPASLFDELFLALCFDTPVILDALAGYALRALLHQPDMPESAVLVLPAARSLASGGRPGEFPAAWFSARATLAIRAAEGGEDPRVVRDLFRLTSVLEFRQLSEPGRRQRIGQARQRIRELIP
jgi:hypothetical protein